MPIIRPQNQNQVKALGSFRLNIMISAKSENILFCKVMSPWCWRYSRKNGKNTS